MTFFVFLTAAQTSFASDRQEMLKVCSSNAKKTIYKNFINTETPPIRINRFTTWLSSEHADGKGPLWGFAHLVYFARQDGQYYSWTFHSITRPTKEACSVESVIKERESKLPPPCEGSECESDENSDIVSFAKFKNTVPNSCFYKSDLIDTISGSFLLPKQVCFLSLNVASPDYSNIKIQGEPIAGDFPLTLIQKNEHFDKYMTYIFQKDHLENGLKVNATLRLSVDILKNTSTIDYSYLAAEFFVFKNDTEFNTHIYYYKRKL